MGRELRRVPMDFDWPLSVRWGGYLNPFYSQRADCADCAGTGLSSGAKRIQDQWYGNAPFDPLEYGATPLTVEHPAIQAFAQRQCHQRPDYYGSGDYAVSQEALRLFNLFRGQWCHHLIQADVAALLTSGRLGDFTRDRKGYVPTADEVNAWSIGGMGHDAINSWVCVRARCKREKVPYRCKVCGGSGERWPSPAIKRKYARWKPVEPPKGDGFQLWETTSEGSPVSPVFASIEALCGWAADNATTFGSSKASAEQWRKMLDANFVCHREGNAIFL